MDRKQTTHMISVMTAWVAGTPIQFQGVNAGDDWVTIDKDVACPDWHHPKLLWRIKPNEALRGVTIRPAMARFLLGLPTWGFGWQTYGW